jgi:GH25 family lysozyme M1 (1,4-beta-N-acetylmuramidase)
MRFVIAKATEGTAFTDPSYTTYRAGARKVHLHFTAYEFADPGPGRRDPGEDAAHFVRVAALKPTDLVPVLDLEQTGGLKPDALITWVETWCNAVERRIGVRPIIYASPLFWVDNMGDTTALADAGDPLWIAHWYVQDPTLPASEWNGLGWSLWQWTDRGSVGGIGGRVDLDLLNGTSFDSLTIANARAAPAPSPAAPAGP